MSSNLDVLKRLHKDFDLSGDDFFKSKQGFTIIVRSGIEKIQYKMGINIEFTVIKCEKDFASILATGTCIEGGSTKRISSFGSALYGEYVDVEKKKGGKKYTSKELKGSTNSHYVIEIAEKRALARVVLKLANLYQYQVFSEDENYEDFEPAIKSKADKLSSSIDEI